MIGAGTWVHFLLKHPHNSTPRGMARAPQAALTAGTCSFRKASYRKRRGYSVACLEEKSLCTEGIAMHIVKIINKLCYRGENTVTYILLFYKSSPSSSTEGHVLRCQLH